MPICALHIENILYIDEGNKRREKFQSFNFKAVWLFFNFMSMQRAYVA